MPEFKKHGRIYEFSKQDFKKYCNIKICFIKNPQKVSCNRMHVLDKSLQFDKQNLNVKQINIQDVMTRHHGVCKLFN